jgi:hypothetical protein
MMDRLNLCKTSLSKRLRGLTELHTAKNEVEWMMRR